MGLVEGRKNVHLNFGSGHDGNRMGLPPLKEIKANKSQHQQPPSTFRDPEETSSAEAPRPECQALTHYMSYSLNSLKGVI